MMAFRLVVLGCISLALPKGDVATGALALATRARTPKRKTDSKRNKSAATGGFAGGSQGQAGQGAAIQNDGDEDAKRAVRNLFSVCSHIQNPELYQPGWADNACLDNEGKVVASRDTKKGNVLTLFPIHALGLRTFHRNADAKKKKRHKRDDTEFVAYDLDDGEYFQAENQQAGLRMKLNIPLDDDQPASAPILGIGGRKNKVLFSMAFREETLPGWLGGRVRSSGTSRNCVTIPLPGAAPLCAVVATRDMKEGEEVVQGITPPDVKVLDECREILIEEYEAELSELKAYIEMACKTTRNPRGDGATAANLDSGNLGPFHNINQQYPGLRQLHQNPDIYAVDNFLSEDECTRVIAKATPHLKPCIIKNESTGAIEEDSSRTSTDANIPQAEAPAIVSKLTMLANCNADQLEILQTLRYTQGQEFKPHTDGYMGPVSACGFEQSNRLITIFCYLNNVGRGGSTYFPEVDLEIRPQRGMAVLHFPSDVELREDDRTVHQGMPAIDEKWLLATWVWSKPRVQQGDFGEGHLPSLSSDVI